MITVDESSSVPEETKEGFLHPASLNSSVDNKLNSASEKSDSEPVQILSTAEELTQDSVAPASMEEEAPKKDKEIHDSDHLEHNLG